MATPLTFDDYFSKKNPTVWNGISNKGQARMHLLMAYSGPSIIRTLDYPDPRLSGSRTEIIARAYNDLRMRVVAVDKKIIVYMAAKSVVLSTEDCQVLGQGCLPLSSTRSSPCSQQLALLALFTATGKRIWPIISLNIRTFHLSGMVFLLLWPKGSG